MFEKSLTDLIRGLRANKGSEERFVADMTDEIRLELRKNDLDIKTNAVSKLCVSCPRQNSHRNGWGYYAAAISFKQDTDVLMLCTNLIKKDMSSNNSEDGSVAMHTLAQIITPDLARDLHMDLIAMLNNSKPYMRKRAILVLYRIFLKYPEALRAAFPRLKERLEDSDPSVVSAAVNVICELARKNPKSYLPLAPQLYGLLTASSNNWTLIKTIKLFAALTPLEPRLIRKLVPPIINLIQTSSAMSLIYECIHTLIIGGMISPEVADEQTEPPHDLQISLLCMNKLRVFIEDPDQNLKYLGLYAIGKLLLLRPKLVGQHRDVILKCLDDFDYSIRQQTLELISNLVSPTNLFSIVKRLMLQLVPKNDVTQSKRRLKRSLSIQESKYRNQVAHCVISVCYKNTFANISNFEWYLSVLIDLSYCPTVDVGMAIAEQLIQVCVRVKDIIPLAVSLLAKVLLDVEFLDTVAKTPNNTGVLYGVAWVIGEYCEHLSNPREIIEGMLVSQVNRLAPSIIAVYLHNILKVYSFWINGLTLQTLQWEECLELTLAIRERVTFFTTNSDLEVQDRASTILEVLKFVIAETDTATKSDEGQPSGYEITPVTEILPTLFSGEFNPVAANTQLKVHVPEGLDLDAWIHPPVFAPEPDIPIVSPYYSDSESPVTSDTHSNDFGKAMLRDQRQERLRSDPFYLENDRSTTKSAHNKPSRIDIDRIPIETLTLSDLPLGMVQTQARSASPTRCTSLFAKPRPFLDDQPMVSSMVRPASKQYQLKAEEDLPSSGVSGDAEAALMLSAGFIDADTMEQIRLSDPDRYAVLSIDLTAVDADHDTSPIAPTSSGRRLPPAGGPDLIMGLEYEALPDALAKTRKSTKGKKAKPIDGVDGGEHSERKKKSKKEKNRAVDGIDIDALCDDITTKNGDPSVNVNKMKSSKKSKKPKKAKPGTTTATATTTTDMPEDSKTLTLASKSLLDGAIGAPSEATIFYEDDRVELVYTWQHDQPLLPLINATPQTLLITVHITLRPIDPALVMISEYDLHSLEGLVITRESNVSFIINASATRSSDTELFITPTWQLQLAYVTALVADSTAITAITREVSLALPSLVNMIHPSSLTVLDMASEGLLELLTCSPALLPHRVSTQMVVPSSVSFDACVESLSMRLGLRVVEVLDNPVRAASMYGVSVSLGGSHVAALVKEVPGHTNGSIGGAGATSGGGGVSAMPSRRKRGSVVTVDLRAGHEPLLYQLREAVQSVCEELVEGGGN
ncbi:hypothetical protein BASA83_003498 [Batrachochytrium salamandrivorans]|nr:hypothetical protein BASA83_003498 [Batrachochytrium salamandrivorans]